LLPGAIVGRNRELPDYAKHQHELMMRRAIVDEQGWSPAMNAAAGFGAKQGERVWFFEQFNPEPVQIYNSRKDIIVQPRYFLMDWDIIEANDQWIAHDDTTRITKTKMHAGETYHAVGTFMCPQGGRLRITGDVSGSGKVRIVYNEKATPSLNDDAVVWDWQDVPEAGELSHDVMVDVKQRGVIRFILKDGSVEWNPAVAYVKE
jgi:hypothetical protein